MDDETVRLYAKAIADSIIADARYVYGPVVWITGNSYMPPMRSIDLAEEVWQSEENNDGELFAWLVEMVEERLDEADVLLECPDYDNALYAVDLRRWQHVEESNNDITETWDINDEWEAKES